MHCSHSCEVSEDQSPKDLRHIAIADERNRKHNRLGRDCAHQRRVIVLSCFIGLACFLGVVAVSWKSSLGNIRGERLGDKPGREQGSTIGSDSRIPRLIVRDDVDVLGNLKNLTRTSGTSAGEITGVKGNSKKDMETLVASFYSSGPVILLCLIVFSILRVLFPTAYSYYDAEENLQVSHCYSQTSSSKQYAPCPLSAGFFGWLWPTITLSSTAAEPCIGLDHAMMLEFLLVCIKILTTVCLPMALTMCTLHYYFGGIQGKQVDTLTMFSMSNLAPKSWLFRVHAAFMWYIVIGTGLWIRSAKQSFLPRRQAWLSALTQPRCNTCLVEYIPKQYRNDTALEDYFVKMFTREQIETASVVKQTGDLPKLLKDYESACRNLEAAKLKWKSQEKRPTTTTGCCGAADAIEYWTSRKNQLHTTVQSRREDIKARLHTVGPPLYLCTGFVTFTSRHDALIARQLTYTGDATELVLSDPPWPKDVKWTRAAHHPTWDMVCVAAGYGCVALLYITLLPLIVAITNSAKAIKIGEPLQPLVDAIVPTLGLSVCMGFVPTVIILICDTFFTIKAEAWVQLRLQRLYFWFQIVFVLLVTIIGSSIVDTVETIVKSPMSVPRILAETLPKSTNFYLGYTLLQTAGVTKNMLRHVNLIKFLAYRKLMHHSAKDARELSEPEDQDYSGIGARSARWSFSCVLIIVLCQLCPLICFFGLFDCLIRKLCYTYLVAFAETRKADLGGYFFHQSLRQLHWGLAIYVVLMIGLFSSRASFDCVISALLCGVCCMAQWCSFNNMVWEALPYELVPQDTDMHEQHETYIQPELREDD